MALERNNPAIQFDPGFDPGFERMLQHHLKRGGAPVAACSGFDADTASAFIENMLSQSTRSLYESHLAGCPACRRHVIELSRLAESFPLTDPISVPVNERQPLWLKGKSAVSEWLDFSQWRWNWRSAGLAGAAMTVLIAALSLPIWRQMNRPAPGVDAVAPSAVGASDKSFPITGSDLQVQSPARSSADSVPVAENSRVRAKEIANSPNPEPSVTPNLKPETESPAQPSIASLQELGKFGTPTLPPVPAPTPPAVPRVTSISIPSGQAAVTVTPESATQMRILTDGLESSERRFESPQRVMKSASTASGDVAGRAKQEVANAAQSSANLIDPQVRPSDEDNPMHRGPNKGPGRASNRQPENRKTHPSLLDRAKAFVPYNKGDRDEKTTAIKLEEEGIKPMIVHIDDRTFRHQRSNEGGILVDVEYKPGTEWRGLTKLVQGSEEYNRVLKNEPRLKPFFDKAPIIVKWGDKIYKVVVRLGDKVIKVVK